MKPPPAESHWERDVQNIWGTSEFTMVTVRGPSSWLEYPQLDSCNRRQRPCEVPCQFPKRPYTIVQAFSMFFSTSWALQLHWRPFRKTSQPNAVVIFTVMTNHPQSSQVSHSKSWQPLVSDSAPEPSFCSVPRNRCAPSRTCAIGSSDPLWPNLIVSHRSRGTTKREAAESQGPKTPQESQVMSSGANSPKSRICSKSRWFQISGLFHCTVDILENAKYAKTSQLDTLDMFSATSGPQSEANLHDGLKILAHLPLTCLAVACGQGHSDTTPAPKITLRVENILRCDLLGKWLTLADLDNLFCFDQKVAPLNYQEVVWHPLKKHHPGNQMHKSQKRTILSHRNDQNGTCHPPPENTLGAAWTAQWLAWNGNWKRLQKS